jgi:hypothetical protein
MTNISWCPLVHLSYLVMYILVPLGQVVVRTTVCGTVVMDGNDKAIILDYIPNSSVLKCDCTPPPFAVLVLCILLVVFSLYNDVLTCTQIVDRAEETTITVGEESNQSCQVSITPSRAMSKKVKKIQLQFVMKDPQVWAGSFCSSVSQAINPAHFHERRGWLTL